MHDKIAAMAFVKYIEFVYRTSKLSLNVTGEFWTESNRERFIVLFWHGDSFCLYPALKGSKLYVVTTSNRRGDYITGMCQYFDYKMIRVPDISDGHNHIFRISKMLSDDNQFDVAISMDGPLGPYHEPKDLIFAISLLTKRKVVPISVKVKRKIIISRRWDKFKIPLPFNKIAIHFHDPVTVKKEDRNDNFSSLKASIKATMENAKEASSLY